MNIPNSDFDFDRDASAEDRMAFTGSPRRVLWSPAQPLLRFLTPNHSHLLSYWWFSQETCTSILRTARQQGTDIPSAARQHLAVKPAWNPAMDRMCRIRLCEPAYAWVGVTREQPLDDVSGVMLPGGLEQIYLPGISVDEDRTQSRFARFDWFGATPDFF